MKPVIEVAGISKTYQISHQNKPTYGTLKDDMSKFLKGPFGGGSQSEAETFWALKEVGFTVNKGEIFGIIGKNGSGKSTLLKILSRIVEPTAGKVTMQGKVASLLEVGTGFHPELTGRENIFFNGSMIGMSKREVIEKFDEIVEFSEIGKFLDTPVKYYSSGMYVRLAFAVAAHLDPDILILDEVLAVGDTAFQKKSLEKMLSIARSGRTIILVTHSMAVIEELCTRAMLLQRGRVRAIGDAETVITQYLEGIPYESASVTGEKLLAKRKLIEDEEEKESAKKDKPQKPRVRKFALKTEIKYEDIEFGEYKVNGQPVSEDLLIDTAKPVTLELKYSTEREIELNFGFGLRRQIDNCLAVFTHGGLEKFQLAKAKGEGLVTCTIDLPKIAPGQYWLELHAWVDKQLALTEEKICEIDVKEVRAFASRELFPAFPSVVMAKSHWESKKR